MHSLSWSFPTNIEPPPNGSDRLRCAARARPQAALSRRGGIAPSPHFHCPLQLLKASSHQPLTSCVRPSFPVNNDKPQCGLVQLLHVRQLFLSRRNWFHVQMYSRCLRYPQNLIFFLFERSPHEHALCLTTVCEIMFQHVPTPTCSAALVDVSLSFNKLSDHLKMPGISCHMQRALATVGGFVRVGSRRQQSGLGR